MRLIDADKLLFIYKKWIPQLSLPEDEGDKRGVETCIAVLEDAPTVDAVEVVHCKECKWRNTNGCPFVICNAVARIDEDYCSDGEKG